METLGFEAKSIYVIPSPMLYLKLLLCGFLAPLQLRTGMLQEFSVEPRKEGANIWSWHPALHCPISMTQFLSSDMLKLLAMVKDTLS